MKSVWYFITSFAMLAACFLIVLVAGTTGLFFLMWSFFVVVSIAMLVRKQDRIAGIAWSLFTLGILGIYIWTWIAS
jgi:hypothetical protein